MESKTIFAIAFVLVLITGMVPMPMSAQAVNCSTPISSGSQLFGIAINPKTNLIYLAGATNVDVIQVSSNCVIDTIPTGDTFGIAVNTKTNLIYAVDDGVTGHVKVINGTTNNVTNTIAVGSQPLGVSLNPITNMVYVANYNSNTTSVINGANNTVVSTIPVGGGPHGVTVNPRTNTIYVANSLGNSVSVIDGATNSVVGTISVGNSPDGINVNPRTNTIYVGNVLDDSVSVINGATNTVVSTISGFPGPVAIAVNPKTNLIYVGNDNFAPGEGLAVINGANNTIVNFIDAGRSLGDTVKYSKTSKVYSATFPDNLVTVTTSTTEDEAVVIASGAHIHGCEKTYSCYLPFSLKIKTGETVAWTNADSTVHTATSVPNFDSGIILPGQIFKHTFSGTGTFAYHCTIHPWITGKLTVI